ncbi:MAG: hypothetical protein CM15mP126_1220 [Gammaproteobacteria bacterium]|nr:MAG: hypothetical protein CM15mP126_1220 [Gammaproteobacteria bacterium]
MTTYSDEIWAKEEKLTGSIGVYGIVPTLDGIYDWAGIRLTVFHLQKLVNGVKDWQCRLFTESIQASIDHTYDKFVSKIAENKRDGI